MQPNDKDLNNQELKVLRAKLPAMLTVTEAEAMPLLRDSLDQAVSIADALDVLGAERKKRQWLGHSMASLPLKNWTKKDGFFSVTPTRDASLRYLFQVEKDDAEGKEQLDSRKRLFDELSLHLHDMPARFQPMLTWTHLYPDYPLNSDIALLGSIDIVERLFAQFYNREETRLRAVYRLAHAPDIPTPIEHIPRLAKQTYSDVREQLLELSDGPQDALAKDHLVAHLMCNVAANRWLLESARLGALAQDAAKLNVKLIKALNSRDIYEVPDVKTDDDIEAELTLIFGKGGKMSGVDGLSRYSRPYDIATALSTAKAVQKHYRGTRAASFGENHACAHSTPRETLLFAFALMGAFAAKTEVKREFFGHDQRYAAFPAPGTQEREGDLRPHALELAKTMYGQMAFASVGWRLLATQVREYEQAMAVKRSCLQTLIFYVFKRWPAGKLSVLHRALSGANLSGRLGDPESAPWPKEA